MSFQRESLPGAVLVVAVAALAGACGGRVVAGDEGRADRIFVNGRVYTADPELVRAEAVAVAGGRILAVGSDAEIRALAGPGTDVVDVGGAHIFPGLVDAHAHLVSLGHALATVDLRDTKSYDAVLEKVRSAAEAQPEGWIVGRGWDQNDWPDKTLPDGARLEEVAAGRAVWLRRIDGHAGLASPAALKAAGVADSTVAPEGGRIERRADGTATGVLVDNAMPLVSAVVPDPPRNVVRARLEAALADAVRVGLTGVHDMGVTADTLSIYRELHGAGRLPIRVYAVLSPSEPKLDEILARGPTVGERLTVRAVKLFIDGALGSRGAALLADYADDPGNSGLLLTPPDELRARIEAIVAAGFQPAIHAIGDGGNRIVLDAYEAVLATRASVDVRPRIEHAQVLAPEDLPRLAALGVVASMQPTHATSDMPWAGDRLGPERLVGAYAWRTLARAGTRIAFGSDFPVERTSVLEGLYAAVSRMDRTGEPAGGWRVAEALTLAEAVEAFTTGSAYASFTENRRGMLRPGYDADLTIVRGDLESLLAGRSDLPAKAILDSEILMTVVAGRTVYAAP